MVPSGTRPTVISHASSAGSPLASDQFLGRWPRSGNRRERRKLGHRRLGRRVRGAGADFARSRQVHRWLDLPARRHARLLELRRHAAFLGRAARLRPAHCFAQGADIVLAVENPPSPALQLLRSMTLWRAVAFYGLWL